MAEAVTHIDAGADRRLEQRLRLVLPGRFSSGNRYDAPCVTEDVSPSGIGILTATKVNVFDSVDLRIRDLGQILGEVVRVTPNGFGMRITRASMDRSALARQMIYLANSQRVKATPQRKAERITPMRKSSTLHLDSNRVVPVTIINYSASGAAVTLPEGIRPEMGSAVVVGRKAATVVRHMEGCMGVTFIHPFDADKFNDRVVL